MKDPERSMTMDFIGFYIFKCHQGDEIRLKHYAGILLIGFWANLIYNSGRVRTRPLSTAQVEAKMARPARSACHDLYQIYQVLSLHIPQWSSNDALIVWRSVSGRFLGPIKRYTDRKSASASRLGRRLVYCQYAGSINKTTWRCQVCAFSYQYQYDSPHLIPSNVPEVFVFVKTKFRVDISIGTIRSCLCPIIFHAPYLCISASYT